MLVFEAPTPARSVRAVFGAPCGLGGPPRRPLSPGALQRPLRALMTTAEGPTETPGATLASEGPYDGL